MKGIMKLFFCICLLAFSSQNIDAKNTNEEIVIATKGFEQYREDFIKHVSYGKDSNINEERILAYFKEGKSVISEKESEVLNNLTEKQQNSRRSRSGVVTDDLEFMVAERIIFTDGVFELYKDGTFSIETIESIENGVQSRAAWKNKRAAVKKTFYSWSGIKTWTIGLSALFQFNGVSNVKYIPGSAVGTVHLEGLWRQSGKKIYGYNTSNRNRVVVMELDVYQSLGPLNTNWKHIRAAIHCTKTGSLGAGGSITYS